MSQIADPLPYIGTRGEPKTLEQCQELLVATDNRIDEVYDLIRICDRDITKAKLLLYDNPQQLMQKKELDAMLEVKQKAEICNRYLWQARSILIWVLGHDDGGYRCFAERERK